MYIYLFRSAYILFISPTFIVQSPFFSLFSTTVLASSREAVEQPVVCYSRTE